MTDQTATNPVEDSTVLSDTGVADQTVSDDTLDLEVQDEGDEGGETTDEAGELTEEELEEIEHDGKKFKLPKALKPALMMQADYTRKTQELAEQRRTLEASAAQQAQASDDQLQLRGLAKVMDGKLAEYAKVDWNAWRASNPEAARAARDDYQDLQTAKRELDTAISEADRTALEAQRAQHATRLQEANSVLIKEIPGWSPQVANQVAQFGLQNGFTADELNNVTDPRLVKLLHSVMSNASKATQAAKVEKIAAGQKTQPAPATRGGGGQFTAKPDTQDFKAFETMADTKIKARR